MNALPSDELKMGRMRKFKSILAGFIYFISMVMLVNCAIWLEQVRVAFTPTQLRAASRHFPAFSEAVLAQMTTLPILFLASGVVSLVLAIIALRKAASHDAKLFWISLLAAANLFLCANYAMLTIIGLLLLPKLANAP